MIRMRTILQAVTLVALDYLPHVAMSQNGGSSQPLLLHEGWAMQSVSSVDQAGAAISINPAGSSRSAIPATNWLSSFISAY